MIKYNYLADQSKNRIDAAEYIFTQLRRRNITKLPVPSDGKDLLLFFTNEPGSEEEYVYFASDGNGIGYFIEVTVHLHGTARMESAKFHYQNCGE